MTAPSSGPGLGLSGRLTAAFIASPLTPLLLLASLVVGMISLATLPREEEPQISVPMVDILVPANGLKAPDALKLVTEPLETIVKAIAGVEHVYSQTLDDRVMVTARFLVGTPSDSAILRVHEKIRANLDRIPVGIPEPLVVGRGIDDVAIVVATLAPDPAGAASWDAPALYSLAQEVRSELARLDNIGLTYLVGTGAAQIRIEPDPEGLSRLGITLDQLLAKLQGANRSFLAGTVRQDGKSAQVVAGQTLGDIGEIGNLLLTSRDGRPVYVKDVARITVDGGTAERRVWHYGPDGTGNFTAVPAVSIAVAKRAGANAVVISEEVRSRLESLKGTMIPDGVNVHITRDYGETANEKANELLFHLALATVSIVILVALAIGWQAGLVVLIVIPTTILLTLFAAQMMGYTINRVSLFALIFAIGILVDDAIVVIENIARHWAMNDGRSRAEAAIAAVAEVGNPTIVATLTVVAALLPMMFVSGLMGPYMSPIPAVASAAMLFSFFVAVVLTPWAMLRIAGRGAAHSHDEGADGGRLGALFRAVARPVLVSRSRSWMFLLVVGMATLASTGLLYTRDVTVKLLPFDNKSELQVVIDMPEGTALEMTERVLSEAVRLVQDLPEITSIQAHAGTAAPFNFNGLVRHYFLRDEPEQGDLQVNLKPKSDRTRESHAVALDIRDRLKGLQLPGGASVKVVEVPPGPPVMSTLQAEIYGPDPDTRRAIADKVADLFGSVPFIVDIDLSQGQPSERIRIAIDSDNLEFHGVSERDVFAAIETLLGTTPVGYSHRGEGRAPLGIVLALPKSDRTLGQRLLATPVPANALPGSRGVVELGDVVRLTREPASHLIYRHNGRPAELVTAELAGDFEAPVYGMLAVADAIAGADWAGLSRPEIAYHGQPVSDAVPVLLWDGEWEVTYITFRDMGAAFAVALLGIYFLVVAQFRSFALPLVILTPVPLTLIGILLGHWAFAAPFSATSMIGFIALAGIIVRNSILLVDFIRHARSPERPLRDVLLEAGSIRFKPILLTALAAMIGAVVILTDPIFQGLAISLLFGLASSTLLTVLVIPAIYIALRDDGRPERLR